MSALTIVGTRKHVVISKRDPNSPKIRPVRVGVIDKATLMFLAEAPLTPGEREDIDAVIDGLKKRKADEARFAIWRFPEIAHEIAELYKSTATGVEKQLIGDALEQALRTVRRHDRALQAPKPEDPPST
jgi:hypothetical protein